MTPTNPRLATAVLTAALAALSTACPKPAAAPDAGSAATPVPAAAAPKRPPFPNMATAAWGQRVLEQRTQNPNVPAAATQASVLDALHDLAPGSEKRAAELATALYKSAATDAERSDAVALMAAALVLDPTVDGYKDRVTDAYGLTAYAATLGPSSSLNQSARVIVGASAGAVDQAKRLLEVVETTPGLSADARLFMALGYKLTGGKLDLVLDNAEKALAAKPGSTRARALVAEVELDVGLYPEAITAATVPQDHAHPWLDAVRGRALVLDGKLDEGLALLKGSQEQLDEGRRGDALYWLARSLTQKEGTNAEVQALQATLAARPGYAKEAAVIDGLLAQRAGDYKKARATLDAVVKGPAVLPVDADATWLLVDACAGLGDTACVDRAGVRGLQLDDDFARLNLARAAAALVGKAEIDSEDALREAHRASPFDKKLGDKIGEPTVDGGAAAAQRLRAARRALVRKSPKLVEVALAPLQKTAACRVCRAITAASQSGVDATKSAAKAQAGAGPPLCVADLVKVIQALGATPLPEAEKALDALAGDKRAAVVKAVERARADHKDPEDRRRRDAGERPAPTMQGPGGAPQLPGAPTSPGAPGAK